MPSLPMLLGPLRVVCKGGNCLMRSTRGCRAKMVYRWIEGPLGPFHPRTAPKVVFELRCHRHILSRASAVLASALTLCLISC